VRYLRVLDPLNPADAGKQVEFDSFTLRRRRRDGEGEAEPEAKPAAVVTA
jgi:hypothetical protein